MLPEKLLGLLRCWHLTHPVVDYPLVIQELEEGILGSPPLFVSHEGDTVAAEADNQEILEAPIKSPSGSGEFLFLSLPDPFSICSLKPRGLKVLTSLNAP